MAFRLRSVIVAGHICLSAIYLGTVESASGGDPVTIRVLDPQGLEAGTFSFPDRDDLGTGAFHSNIPQGALAADPLVRVGGAAPVEGSPGELQITVATSLSKRLVTVDLRRPPRTEPVSRGTFYLPQKFDAMQRHEFEVSFKKWNVSGVTIDGEVLSPRGVR